MNQQLFRLAYFSRNAMLGTSDVLNMEVQDILDASRRNNRQVQVTGALLYNRSCFAQVLEGPLQAVEGAFERIQRDPRHADITVLDMTEVEGREFPAWSMAFAGKVDERDGNFTMLSEANVRREGEAAELIFTLLRDLVLQEEAVA